MGTAPMTIVERCLLGLLLTLAVLGSAVAPAAAPDLRAGIAVPAYAKRYRRPGLTDEARSS